MEYFEFTGGESKGNQLILEPEDWADYEWDVILKLFGLKEAEQVVLSEYIVKVFGTELQR